MNICRSVAKLQTIAGLLLALIAVSPLRAQEPASQPLVLSGQDRILVLSPHPDDDVLGCAGVIQSAVERHLPLRVVYLTNGDNYEWAFWVYRKHPVLKPEEMRKMGLLRMQEAAHGESLLGISPDQLTFLGYPDWGTEKIFTSYWDGHRAFRSMLTKVSAVPYAAAYRRDAPYNGRSVLADLETIMADFKPTKVFVSHPVDGHRDHRAFFLFAQIALWDLADKIHPEVYPFLIHHPRWPHPRGLHPERDLEPPEAWNRLQWFVHPLTATQETAKAAALREHRTQMALDKNYLNSFVAPREWFGRLSVIQVGAASLPAPAVSSGTSEAMEQTVEASTDTAPATLQYVYRENDQLVLKMTLASGAHLHHPVEIYAMGYRHDRPFADMPKLRIQIHHQRVVVSDQDRPVADSGIQAVRDGRNLQVRVPLRALGDPEKIIGTAWSNSAQPPFDRRAWQVLELRGAR
jgi:LmbE family N-acetylglucosaminyl deacetylase